MLERARGMGVATLDYRLRALDIVSVWQFVYRTVRIIYMVTLFGGREPHIIMSRSVDILLSDLPEHILQQPCTDRDGCCRKMLLHMSQTSLLPHTTLGRWLGVPENEIQDIQHENMSSSASEKRYLVSEMLLR